MSFLQHFVRSAFRAFPLDLTRVTNVTIIRAPRGASPSGENKISTTLNQQSPTLSHASTVSAATHAELRYERESIANELLNVLSHIRPVHMEPNSVSFCMKVRGVAGTLLPDFSGQEETVNGRGAVAMSGGGEDGAVAANYLRSFLEILMDLEKSGGPGGGMHMSGNAVGTVEGNLAVELGVEGQIMGDLEDEEDEVELRRWAGLREQQREFATRASSMYL